VSAHRVPHGGRIDRTRQVTFTFDGSRCTGFAGDTLASALLANGVRVLGRSFKYHRPRGLLGAGSEEPNALVTVVRDEARSTPNVRATQVEIYDGLVAASQNRWPSLGFDVMAVNDLLAPLLPAAFYYKTFMWPRSAWHRWYEPAIRRAAGLGHAPVAPDPDRYAQRYAHCDVLVVGAGPAGLAAALAASGTGARVMLCDEQSEPGGSLLAERAATIDGRPADVWLAEASAALAARPNVTLLTRTTAFGYFPHNLIGLCERLTDHLPAPAVDAPRERLWQVRAREVVLTTGAVERPLVFPGNDRPGVMLASAASTYLHRYGVRVGSHIVVVTGCDSGYATALDLHAAGAKIELVADVRETATGIAAQAAREAGLDIVDRATVLGTSGRLGLRAVRIGRLADGMNGEHRRIVCDALLMSGGWTPSVHLHSQSRGKPTWDAARQAFLPGPAAERERSAGACRGVDGLESVLDDGAQAGLAAARAAGHAGEWRPLRATARDFSVLGAPGALRHGAIGTPSRAFVDFQNDVTTKDLALAAREGFESIEHIKRYTTTGMATDQGKTSNLNALAIVAEGLARPLPDVGHTTFRMPYTPVTFGALAGYDRGDLFDPVRTTPTHEWARRHGAVFEDVGQWKRARFFPRDGEDLHGAVARECRAVRAACGIFDASTLGKIEVVGPDAATFLSRMYVNDFTSLAVGRCRYALQLRDDGFVCDDGVIARLADARYHVTTTTGGAARVLALMEDYLQTEWPGLRAWLTSTTEQWAVIAVQGPKAREVLSPLVDGVDLSAGALPHLAARDGRICGVPMRLFRVSFTGELGFEVNIPAEFGQPVWEAIFACGREHGITAYGTETMHVLRAEKGYIIVGQETDGTVTPYDVGLGWAIGRSKPDFVGKRALARPAMHAPDRKQLVGLLTVDPQVVLEEGAQLIEGAGASVSARQAPKPKHRHLIGHVTSSYASAVLGRSIALALIEGGRSRIGQTLQVPMPNGDITVTVTAPVFYDAEGARLHV
jgi:sarcosine oxidase subunit alpha